MSIIKMNMSVYYRFSKMHVQLLNLTVKLKRIKIAYDIFQSIEKTPGWLIRT